MGLFGKKDEKTAAPAAGGAGTDAGAEDWFLPEDSRHYLKEVFAALSRDVHLEVFLKEDKGLAPYMDFTRKFTRDLARVSPYIKVAFHDVGGERARELGVDRGPVVVFEPEKYKIRFVGAPAGEEGRSFVETIVLVGLGESMLPAPVKKLLAELAEPRAVKVFVSPTCPYCPGQVLNGVKAAVERPDLVSFEMIEIGENPDLADRYNVGSVPHTNFNDAFSALGMEPEARFMVELITLAPAEEWLRAHGGAAAVPDSARHVDVVVVGGGPAALSAAVYLVRAGLSAVVLEKANLGGQVAVTPVVENYPGFTSISGGSLVELLAQHARDYCEVREFEGVNEIKLGHHVEIASDRGLYLCHAVILAMGATWKQLGVPGEQRFFGKGVSYCAACDGYLYKGKKVLVVGGGNTALTDALHLKNLGVDVSVVHRRDSLRSEKHLQDALAREQIPVIWNSVVTEVLGERSVTGVRLKDTATGEEREEKVDGVFVAIGQQANSALAVDLGVATHDGGFIRVDAGGRTNIPRVYAAGDITGGVRQIVTATGQGAATALAVFEDLLKSGALARDEQAAHAGHTHEHEEDAGA